MVLELELTKKKSEKWKLLKYFCVLSTVFRFTPYKFHPNLFEKKQNYYSKIKFAILKHKYCGFKICKKIV